MKSLMTNNKQKKKSKRKYTKNDIIEFAKNHYKESLLSFDEDYLIIKYLKVQLNKFLNNKKINMRLVLNYLIILNNVFDSPKNLCKILFLECERDVWPILATFLKFLNLSPSVIILRDNEIVHVDNIIDFNLLETLNNL